MGFSGFTYRHSNKTPIKQQSGVSGFRTFIQGLTPVMVQDSRGHGQPGVLLTAENPTSGVPFSTETDAKGNAYMQLDAATPIEATKDMIKHTNNYVASPQEIIILKSNIFIRR